jgi:DNA-binding GntR family transcriptional regulator
VREAFLLLEAEGLLRLFPKRGALVVPVSAHEIESVLEARELIEGHALRKILRRPAETRTAVTTQLREVLADQEARLATGDERAFVDADRTFHQIIVTEAGNPILLELYQSLRDRQLRMGIGALVRDPDRGRRIVREHTALVEGLEAGDADRLDEHLRQHLDGTRTVLRRA